MENCFSDVDISKLSKNQVKLCEENLAEKDLYNSLKSMQSDKSPGNNRLTKEFYEPLRTELKEIFVDSVSEAKEKGILSTSERQGISLCLSLCLSLSLSPSLSLSLPFSLKN